jgi:hypothetical protein
MSEAIYSENTEEELPILNIKTVDERGHLYDIKIELADKVIWPCASIVSLDKVLPKELQKKQ